MKILRETKKMKKEKCKYENLEKKKKIKRDCG